MSHFGNIGHHLIVAIIDHIPNGIYWLGDVQWGHLMTHANEFGTPLIGRPYCTICTACLVLGESSQTLITLSKGKSLQIKKCHCLFLMATLSCDISGGYHGLIYRADMCRSCSFEAQIWDDCWLGGPSPLLRSELFCGIYRIVTTPICEPWCWNINTNICPNKISQSCR